MPGYLFKTFLRRVNQPNTFPLLLIVLMACLVSVHKNRQLKTVRFLQKVTAICRTIGVLCLFAYLHRKCYTW